MFTHVYFGISVSIKLLHVAVTALLLEFQVSECSLSGMSLGVLQSVLIVVF